MARYTGPKVRVTRRLGVNVFENEKGRKALERRPFPPGAHGRTRRRNAGSEYLAQLQEKQKAKYIYGVLEKQFRSYFAMAEKRQGITGENLLAILETRLDNVVYRLGFAMSRAEARQLVTHGHFTVDGRKVNIPSFLVKPGMVITLKDSSKSLDKIKANVEANASRPAPKWLDYDANNMVGKVVAMPARDDIDLPVEEHLIVELYSK